MSRGFPLGLPRLEPTPPLRVLRAMPPFPFQIRADDAILTGRFLCPPKSSDSGAAWTVRWLCLFKPFLTFVNYESRCTSSV
jgi:hypothetical protein